MINASIVVGLVVAFSLFIIGIDRLIEATETPVSPGDKLSGEKFMDWLRKLLSIRSPSEEILSDREKPVVGRPWIKGKPDKVEVGHHVHIRVRPYEDKNSNVIDAGFLKGRVNYVNEEHGFCSAKFRIGDHAAVYEFYFSRDDVIEYREAE